MPKLRGIQLSLTEASIETLLALIDQAEESLRIMHEDMGGEKRAELLKIRHYLGLRLEFERLHQRGVDH
jgi:hypothetical protein